MKSICIVFSFLVHTCELFFAHFLLRFNFTINKQPCRQMKQLTAEKTNDKINALKL